jgi:hypothetical protein
LLSAVAQALLCNSLCVDFFFPLFWWCRWWLSVETPGFWELDSVLEPIAGVELPKEAFTSRARWMPLIVRWNASTNMFYLLKYLLLLNLVILKLKCNNFILNEILVLYASYVCLLHSHSSRITRSGSWKIEPSFLRWFCHSQPRWIAKLHQT